MKGKKSTTKKVKNTEYAFGGSVKDPIWDYLNIKRERASNIPNQIESPDTALADNDIRLARAAQKASNNPWTQGLDLFGNLAMQVGSSMMSQGISKGQGISEGGFNWGSLMQQGIGGLGTFANSSFATGGKVPINAEGGEVIETPGGEPQELQGNSHAEGGIDLQVPEGTEIYSKRLKGPDGKSMADRKKARERQLAKLEKLVESNPTDKTIRKTLEKTKKDFQIQEQQDMQKMQMAHQVSQIFNIDSKGEVTKHKLGGIAGNPPGYSKNNVFYEDPFNTYKKIVDNYQNTYLDAIMESYNNGYPIRDNIGNINHLPSLTDKEETIPTLYPNKNYIGNINHLPSNEEPDEIIPDIKSDKYGESTTSIDDTKKDNIFNKMFKGDGMTIGDMVGLGGQLYSIFAPMKNTIANRAGDTPNINAFKEYGKDGLKSLDKSKQYVNQIRDEQLKDLQLNRTGQISRNRNTARGINTQRALDLATDSSINNIQEQIYNQFMQAMQQIYGQEAQMENQQDQVVMQGEQNRDLADRQDRDNYFSQLAQDIATKGTGLQHLGDNINQVKERDITNKVLNQAFPNFNFNTISGEVQQVLTEEIVNDATFYSGLDGTTAGKIVRGIMKKEYIKKDGKLYNPSGQEIDKKTLQIIPNSVDETIKEEQIKKNISK